MAETFGRIFCPGYVGTPLLKIIKNSPQKLFSKSTTTSVFACTASSYSTINFQKKKPMHIFPDATHTGCKYLICYPCNVACRFSVECERDFPNFVLIGNCLSGKNSLFSMSSSGWKFGEICKEWRIQFNRLLCSLFLPFI